MSDFRFQEIFLHFFFHLCDIVIEEEGDCDNDNGNQFFSHLEKQER